ncbi:ComF family protein [Marinomonas atlantica]|uniref:ComF family protein n=1 Tax=Marinomonas atlantica TaxID=1806668 RepID=UPI0008365742|nr:phosphoribosyltransferase family protein [Marinomonas atlantica]
METNLIEVHGNWEDGYVLDRHTIHSEIVGHNSSGYPIWDNTRSEVGEAIYQLKYQGNDVGVDELAETMAEMIDEQFGEVDAIIPLSPSKARAVQPVSLLANAVADELGIDCIEDVLVKNGTTQQMKDLSSKEERMEALLGCFSVIDNLDDVHDIVLLDDLFSSGSTMEAATLVLREYDKIDNIYVAAFTKTRS